MNAQELWALAVAHHVPYFIAGMLMIWQWPNLLFLWGETMNFTMKRRVREPVKLAVSRNEGGAAPSPEQLRVALRHLEQQQSDVARQLQALQRQNDLAYQHPKERV